MLKNYSKFVTTLFCGFLGVVVAANALTPDKSFSEMENRNLAQKPVVSLNGLLTGKFMSEYESYVTDQFAGRDGWTAAKAAAELASGKQENNGVYFCGGSTLITRFDAPDAEKVEKNLTYINKFAGLSSVPVYFGLIPGAATVWADRLPEGAPNYDQKLVIDRAAQSTAAQFIDLYTPLMEHKSEEIFYRTDHHWTSLGAYYGYTGVAGALGLTPVPLTDYVKTTVSTDFYGTVFSSSGVRWVRPDSMDTYVPEDGVTVTSYTYDAQGNPVEVARQLYDESFLAKKDKYAMFLGGQQALGVVRTGHTDKPKLLLIRDSYSDSLVPFLTPHFSEIHLIDLRYYKQSAAQYIQDNGIDTALVLYSVPNFVSDTNLVWLGR
ncbi:MAG: DHHW family protein [Pseudoflavonifractor sp.]|nr:DHHW family protein [Pseudoflavonifractor sp.]MDY3020247.1 DHHW family protein [Oscillospiraceae bacterium]